MLLVFLVRSQHAFPRHVAGRNPERWREGFHIGRLEVGALHCAFEKQRETETDRKPLSQTSSSTRHRFSPPQRCNFKLSLKTVHLRAIQSTSWHKDSRVRRICFFDYDVLEIDDSLFGIWTSSSVSSCTSLLANQMFFSISHHNDGFGTGNLSRSV